MKISAHKKYSLTDFFNAHWDNYVKQPAKPIKPEHYKAVNAIRTCRTEVLGKRIYACPDCGDIAESFHSCKHRFCPNCSWNDTIKWAEKAYRKLINKPHRHERKTQGKDTTDYTQYSVKFFYKPLKIRAISNKFRVSF